MNKKKINALLKTTKRVFLDCALENGAIVAGNSDKKYYPKNAYNYRYVWPRDAAYICVAARKLGLNIHKSFFEWLLERAENFSEDGILFQNYHVNGPKRWTAYQPDQNPTLIWAIREIYGEKIPSNLQSLLFLLADGILRMWDQDHFRVISQDLWEERMAFPDLKQSHVYSLSACIYGLKTAYQICGNAKYKRAETSMSRMLARAYEKGTLVRTVGEISDSTPDVSLLGLVYPFEIMKPRDLRIAGAVYRMENICLRGEGLCRYPYDAYDGWRYHGNDRKQGAGVWPLLNFWMSIYYSRFGNRAKAEQYFSWVIKQVDEFIPEQIFDNKLQQSIQPLAWSHAMLVLAAKELEYI